MFVHGLIFVVLWARMAWRVVFFFSFPPFYNICCDRLCVKSNGNFNTDSIQVHTAPFMVHISSTPVVKYLIVIRAYLFKW